MIQKEVITKLQVRFNDLDMAGHVHNSEYLNYFEIGRIDFFNNLLDSNWDWKEKGILVARNEIDYISPVFFNDTIFVKTAFENFANKSLTLSYEVFSDTKGVKKIFSKGKSILVCFDFKTNKSVKVFEEWKSKLKE